MKYQEIERSLYEKMAYGGRNMTKNRLKKRKIIAVLLLCILAVSGCGKKQKAESDRESVLDFIDEKDKEKTTTEEKKDDKDEEGKKEESSAAPCIEILGEYVENRYYEGSDLSLCNLTYNMICGSGKDYPKLSSALDDWSMTREKELHDLLEEYANYALEDEALLNQALEQEYHCMYDITQSLALTRSDSQVVSIVEYSSDYFGGPHGNYWYQGINFDAKTGEILSISEVIKDKTGFYPAANDYIAKKIEQKAEQEDIGDLLWPDYTKIIENMWNEEVSWYFDASGLTIVFNPYEIAAYAVGTFFITLPYSEFGTYFSDQYFNTSLEGVIKLQPEEVYSMETSEGTVDVKISMQSEYEYGFNKVQVCVGELETEVGEFSYVENAYILKRNDNKVFLIITCDYMSNDYATYLYDITEGKVKLCDEMMNASIGGGNVNTDSVDLCVYLDVLGSYASRTAYTIDRNGQFHQVQDLYQIGLGRSPHDSAVLTTIKELPVILNGEATVLPVGSRITITGTDNESVITFYDLDTCLDGEIHYVRGDGGEDTWTIYIEGCPDYEYFENLPYAG